jgi:hypothetical protein
MVSENTELLASSANVLKKLIDIPDLLQPYDDSKPSFA